MPARGRKGKHQRIVAMILSDLEHLAGRAGAEDSPGRVTGFQGESTVRAQSGHPAAQNERRDFQR